MTDYLRHFGPHEIGKGVDPLCAAMLDIARERSGFPYVVSSASRTEKEQEELIRQGKGAKGSLHVMSNSPSGKARAFDLEWDGRDRLAQMILDLMAVGFNQILVYDTYLHVEWDEGKVKHIEWV